MLAATFLPSVTLGRDGILMVVAVFGTTLSPYLFFWQASQEAEEARLNKKKKSRKRDEANSDHFRKIPLDTWIGVAVSDLIGFSIIVTTAPTLHAHGVTHIETAAQAAEALRRSPAI